VTRAAKMCSTTGCPHLQPCPDHPKVAWAGSTRSERTKNGWQQQREAELVMRRDEGICHVCKRPGADQVDHVIPTSEHGADDVSNKAPIHTEPCHRIKTQEEAQRARRAGADSRAAA
jgi:5-methylcytosine-specific restriction endonuclease McrA